MTDSLFTQLSQLRAQLLQQKQQQQQQQEAPPSPSPSSSTIDSYIALAGQVISNHEIYHVMNRALLLDKKSSSSSDENNNSEQQQQQQQQRVQDYFFVLCEWYKTNHDLLKFPLLNHLPVCLYSELTSSPGEKNPIVQAVLLCIYNCEAFQRNNNNNTNTNNQLNGSSPSPSSSQLSSFRLMTQLFNNQKSIYNIAEVHHTNSGLSDTSANSASNSNNNNNNNNGNNNNGNNSSHSSLNVVGSPAAASTTTTTSTTTHTPLMMLSDSPQTSYFATNGGIMPPAYGGASGANGQNGGSMLTSSALQSFNRNQQLSSLEMKHTFVRDCKLPLLNSMTANDSFQTVVRILLQVFIQYLDVFDAHVLLDMCHVMYRVMSGGMPYVVPSWQYISQLDKQQQQQKHQQQSHRLSKKMNGVENVVTMVTTTATTTTTAAAAAVVTGGEVISTEQIELTEVMTSNVHHGSTNGSGHSGHTNGVNGDGHGDGDDGGQMYTDRERQVHMSLLIERSAIEKLSHMQLLQLVLNNTGMRRKGATAHSSYQQHQKHDTPRVHLDKGVINELITIVKYCVCAAKHLQALYAASESSSSSSNKRSHFDMIPYHHSVESLLYGTLYAVHARVMYEQIPELMLYTRSILSSVI